MAGAEGLEPSTYGLEGRCSIQLSYTPVVSVSTRAGTFRLLVFSGATGEAGVYPQWLHAVYSAVAVPYPAVYTGTMQSLDTGKPARAHQEATEAAKARRRSLHKLLLIAVVMGALLGFAAGLLVADRWYGGREVIFVPTNGIEV